MSKDTITFNDLRRKLKKGEFRLCLNPLKEECSDKGIGSHSIQNHGILSKLAVDNHVYIQQEEINYPKTKEELHRFIEKKMTLIGINEASTFFGFCNKHDTEIFKPIESDNFSASPLENFLYAYRAFAYEYYYRLDKEKTNRDLSKVMENQKILMFPNLGENDRQIKAFSQMLKDKSPKDSTYADDFKIYEMSFNRMFEEGKYDGLKTFVYKIPYEVSFAVNSTFYLEFDLNRKDLNYSAMFNPYQKAYPMFFNVFPENNHSYALLSVFNKDLDIFSEMFKTIETLNEVYLHRLINNITLFYCLHNTAISPSLLNSFSEEDNKKLRRIMNSFLNLDEDNKNKQSLLKKPKVNLMKY